MDTENKIRSMKEIEEEKAKVEKIPFTEDVDEEKKKVKEKREEIKKTEKNVSNLELISNQILTGLEKDFVSSEQQHMAEMNRVRQEFEKERRETTVLNNNHIANVRRDMNDQLNKKDREIQQLREDKKDAESKLRSMRDSILAAIGK